MDFNLLTNAKGVQAKLDQMVKAAQTAALDAANNALSAARDEVVKDMTTVFDRPTSWAINSLRIQKANDSANPAGSLAFQDVDGVENSRTMMQPQVDGGTRHYKAMEARLMGMGFLPAGWNVVPGAAAVIDGNGNMSRAQITQVLNVLAAYAGGGQKKGRGKSSASPQHGVTIQRDANGPVFWVNPVGGLKGKHLPRGVYQRVAVGRGTRLRPILIFVRRAHYRARLNFYGRVSDSINRSFPTEFAKAMQDQGRMAFLRQTGGVQ